MPFIILSLFIFFIEIGSVCAQDHKNRDSIGLLSSDLDGAFPKSLWKNQPQSEIQFLLSKLPAHGTNRALQQIKKRLLLSQTDTSLIEQDMAPEHAQDLFLLRLQKLMALGHYLSLIHI